MSTSTKAPDVTIISNFERCHTPVKKIFSADDISTWLQSEAYARIMTVLVRSNLAVRSKGIRDGSYPQSQITKAVVAMLDQLEDWVTDIPLDTGVQRFGNKAFRLWGARLEEQTSTLHDVWLPQSHKAILPELSYYFQNAFGNWTRIDYGSGHELSFLGYMTILRYTGLWNEEDEVAMIFTVFERYLRLCRKLQARYTLEPAGSKGVWGLEDHQFLNLLWGSSQLIGHDSIRPSDILKSTSNQDSSSSDYLFLSSVEHIKTLKRGPFNEHSPVLYSIATTVPSWSKVNSGLMKMYQAEVLEKHPVVQHFYFGEMLPWTRRGTNEELPSSGRADEGGDLVDDEQSDGVSKSSSATKAPWAVTGDTHPLATTKAPWAGSTARTFMSPSTTSAPWSYGVATDRGNTNTSATSTFSRTSMPASTHGMTNGATLASTGSAAAMSSPLGVISRPSTMQPASRKNI